jgi:hypothetical protein
MCSCHAGPVRVERNRRHRKAKRPADTSTVGASLLPALAQLVDLAHCPISEADAPSQGHARNHFARLRVNAGVEGKMARVLALFAVLAFLSGVVFSVKPHRSAPQETLPDSIGYADTISEGAGTN